VPGVRPESVLAADVAVVDAHTEEPVGLYSSMYEVAPVTEDHLIVSDGAYTMPDVSADGVVHEVVEPAVGGEQPIELSREALAPPDAKSDCIRVLWPAENMNMHASSE
jgi:hypothetical protein